MRTRTPSVLLLLLCVSCSQPAATEKPVAVDGTAIKAHIQKLASDEMEGRAPAGKGADLATEYVSNFFKSIGLKTQFQAVPMVGITSTASPLQLSGKGGKKTLKYGDDVKGKIIVVFINDPQLDDQSKFGGKAMTYYGRWTYKFEEAARQGAAGALIVHETDMASYPWEVVRGSWSGEQFDIVRPDKGASTVPLQGWITRAVAAELFKSAGVDFDDMKRRALQQDFKPVPLGINASVEVKNQMRSVDSKNVIGVLGGSEKPDEYVIFTAHWDHLGIGEAQNADKIYNGAVDNASGVASIMEIARAATKIQPKPKRSLVFMAVTGEEQGLLGSEYYGDNPVFPLAKTLANINIDEANVFGPNNQITAIGFGYTTLQDVLAEVEAQQQRVVVPEGEPEKGFYYRSDQFSFAKHGVPGSCAR